MATLVGIAGTSTGPSFDAVLLAKKQDKLFAVLRDLEQVLVAYSGGTDSAYLAWAAARVLGDKAVAITADSASIPESHKRDAEEFAREANFATSTFRLSSSIIRSTSPIILIAVSTARTNCLRDWMKSARREASVTLSTE